MEAGSSRSRRRNRPRADGAQAQQELVILDRIANVFLTARDEDVYEEVLRVVRGAMDSPLGLFGYINENGDLICPAMTRGDWSRCTIPDDYIMFSHNTWTGMWGRSLREKKTLYTNQPTRVPEEHWPLHRVLNVPIVHKGKLVGMFTVANKPTDYGERDCQLLETIAAYTAPILEARLQRDWQERDRQRAEEAYRALVEHSLQGFCILQEGRIVFANHAFVEMGGYCVEEMKGMSSEAVRDCVHPDDRARVWGYYRDRLQGKEVPDRYEFRFIHKDGRVYWLESCASLITYQGTPATQLAVVDITERRRAEQALRESEERYRTFFENATDIIYTGDLTTKKLTSVNQAIERILGYTAEEVLGTRIDDYLTPDQRSTSDEMTQRKLDGARSTRYEITVLAKDGREVPLEVNSWFRYEDGRPVAYQGVARDITTRRQAQEALREREELYRLLAENTSDMISRHLPDSTYLYVSPACRTMFGYEPEELIGRRAFDFMHPDDVVRVMATCQEAVEKGGSDVGQYRRRTKDGQYVWIETRGHVIRDEATGEVLDIVCSARDITGRRRAEEALRESEERLRQLIESAEDVISLHDLAGRFLYYNGPSRFRFGATDMLGKTFYDVLDEAEAATLARQMGQVVAAEMPMTFENRMTIQGESLWFSDHVFPVRDAADSITRVARISRNVTERKEVEGRLRLVSSAVEQSSEGIGVASLDGTLVFVNDAFAELHGYAQEELVGRHLSVLHTPEQMLVVNEALAESARSGEFRGEIGHVRRNGTTFPTFMHISLLRDEAGRAVGMIGTMRDITERKRMEQRIRDYTENLEQLVQERTARVRELEQQANEMEKLAATGRIAAGVAHEINNPLTGIRNSLVLVKQAIPTDHQYYSFVELIEREIERITNIVRQMYRLYRPKSSQLSRVNVGSVLRETHLLLQRKIEQRELRIRNDVPPDLPQLQLPEGDLRQIIYNLLLNALQASPDGAEVLLRVRSHDDALHIEIADQGEGIPPEVLPKVFEAFFTTKKQDDDGGMGLGLSVSHSLARAMGARIDIDTEPGQGTTFTLSLPLATSLVR